MNKSFFNLLIGVFNFDLLVATNQQLNLDLVVSKRIVLRVSSEVKDIVIHSLKSGNINVQAIIPDQP